MTNKIQKTKLIHAELKNGDFYKYLWLGNDDFADLWNDWDFESNEGKFKGMLDFDQTFGFTFEMDEIKDEKSIIGKCVELGFLDEAIVDFTLEDVIWEETTYPNKITIPSETWVELYTSLSSFILHFSALDPVWTEDENGGEVYTEDAQNKFMDISEQVEDILSLFFNKG